MKIKNNLFTCFLFEERKKIYCIIKIEATLYFLNGRWNKCMNKIRNVEKKIIIKRSNMY